MVEMWERRAQTLEYYAKKTKEAVEVTTSTIVSSKNRKGDDDEQSSLMKKRLQLVGIEKEVRMIGEFGKTSPRKKGFR
jgi:DNA-binding transcriptional regulator/RsmH inhibitor MraZ